MGNHDVRPQRDCINRKDCDADEEQVRKLQDESRIGVQKVHRQDASGTEAANPCRLGLVEEGGETDWKEQEHPTTLWKRVSTNFHACNKPRTTMWRWQRGQIANTAVAAGSAAGSTEPVRCDDGELGGLGKAP